MVKLLELFKGTGSAGKVAEKLKMKVLSLDNEEKYDPDIVIDILKWDYKKNVDTPDLIWASPPCSSFSNMALTKEKTHKNPARVRNVDTMRALAPSAVLGDKLLNKTIEIIRYFSKKNPKLKWVIENPHGSMWRSPLMDKLPKYHREMTYYCLYGDKRKKPTDFFSNIKLNLKEGSCKARVDFTKLKLCDRYKLPPPLVKDILIQIRKTNALRA